MNLRIPRKLIERLSVDLARAKSKEIGGVLFGEQIAEGDFRMIEATRQSFWGGTERSFRRRGGSARSAILALHERLGGDPSRFNYLGEWHSHPNAPAIPSGQDDATMRSLISEQDGSVSFLVLMILRLDGPRELQVGTRAYLSSGHTIACSVEVEDTEDFGDRAFEEEET